ncbi:MAG TPA: SRPBCC family protein [Candidatus Bathyarchaeia archaeon]|nr:SRPBCC family protein [Candidatus Bathyarchaeia archaeon]
MTKSLEINSAAEKLWTTLRTFGGNEKFNPLVTSSRVDGHGVGSKRICYVTLDGGKTVSETTEILTLLNENDRTMEYKVTSASNTPFEGLLNKITVSPRQGANDLCVVEFTGSFEAKDEKSKIEMERTLQDTYEGILNGLKKMHEAR